MKGNDRIEALAMDGTTSLPTMATTAGFELSLLETNPRILVPYEDGSYLLVQKNGARMIVTWCDDEQEIARATRRLSEFAPTAKGETYFSNEFSMKIENLVKLFVEQDAFEDLVNTLLILGDIDTDRLIEQLLVIKRMYSVSFILDTLKDMEVGYLAILMKTDEPLSFFNEYLHGTVRLEDYYSCDDEEDLYEEYDEDGEIIPRIIPCGDLFQDDDFYEEDDN